MWKQFNRNTIYTARSKKWQQDNGNGKRIICTNDYDTSKGFDFFATDKNKNEAKFKFQGQSAIWQRWFDLDLDWIEVNFSTLEPYFYK